MELLTEIHKANLKALIGKSIDFALTPNLHINKNETYPDTSLYNIDYGHFYTSPLINLRIRNTDDDKYWIKLSPGPDAPITPWAPLWAEKLILPDFNGITKDLSGFQNERSNISDENDYLDLYADGLGMTRSDYWQFQDKIKQIEIFEFNPYAACVFKHESGLEWCLYAEYDFLFWINFDKKMVEGIRKTSESSLIIN